MKKLLSLIVLIAPVFLAAQTDSTQIAEKTKSDTAEVLQVADVPPSYPGGDAAMTKFISKKIKYPKKARKDGIEGRVLVQFVIEKDGTTSSHVVLKDIGYGCGEEVIRVIKKMPKWNPGMQKGEAVRVRMVIPVTFKITEED